MLGSAKKPLVIFIYAALVSSTLLVFWQVHDFGFVYYDDNVYVYENPTVANGLSWSSLATAFAKPHEGNWLPLTWVSFMLDRQFFGIDPGRMHLVNVLLHLANTLLLFTVLRKMTGTLWPSAFVAAAFALHPMHVESVAWITERKDVLSTFFLLLTLAAYTGYVRRPSIFRYLMTLVLFALGLLSKPMLVTLPLLLLLLDYWPLNRVDLSQRHHTSPPGRLPRRMLVEKVPFFVLSAASSLITFVTQQSSGTVSDLSTFPLHTRLANAFLSYARYIEKMFWPRDLAVLYPVSAVSFATVEVVLSVLLLLVVSILVIRAGGRRKYLVAGWFWFVASLLPVIGLIQSGAQSMADRYTYIPYIGLFIMVAWGVPELLPGWSQRKVAMGLLMATVLPILGIYAHTQVGYWSSSIALWSHTIEITRDNYIAYNNLGAAYNGLGRWEEAIDKFDRAIAIKPDHVKAYNNRGSAYGNLGRVQEAMEDFRKAMDIDPGNAESYFNLGVAYDDIGKTAEAIDAYEHAVRIDPDYADAHNNRGLACVKLGRWQEAAEEFSQAIRIRPNHTRAHNLGVAYGKLGRGADAIDAYKLSIKIKPDYAETRYDLANEFKSQARYDEAIEQYRIALRLKPDWPDCISDLVSLIATHPQIKNRDTNEAIRLAARACELTNYEDPVHLGILAAAYASAGKFSEAVDTANKALNLADAAKQPQVKDTIRYHLSFYAQGKPYIEPAPKPLPDPNKP